MNTYCTENIDDSFCYYLVSYEIAIILFLCVSCTNWLLISKRLHNAMVNFKSESNRYAQLKINNTQDLHDDIYVIPQTINILSCVYIHTTKVFYTKVKTR